MYKKGSNRVKNLIIIASTLLVIPLQILLLITHTGIIKYPSQIKTSGEFCIEGYFIFPNHYKISTEIPSEINIHNKQTLFNRIDLLSNMICIKPTILLEEKSPFPLSTSYISTTTLGIFKKDFNIPIGKYPEIKELNPIENINTNEIVDYNLTYYNEFLNYHIRSNEKIVDCNKEDSLIHCDITNLELEQGSTYDLELFSTYNEKEIKVIDIKNVNILTNITVLGSSIENKSVIQSTSIPVINIDLNKEIEDSFTLTLQDSENNLIPYDKSLTGNTISITPTEQFKQATTYFLKITDIKGKDGSNLPGEYVLEFSTDDGPKITATNLTNIFPISNVIVLTFNQNILKSQNIKSLIKVDSTNNYSYNINKNRITINPTQNLTPCKSYTLTVAQGLLGDTNLISSKDYSQNFKTSCKRASNIGTSVQGRPIYAYYFGNGDKKIVFFASMHGSESNTKNTLNKLISELETYNSNIPSDKTVIVIPTINPDGIANKSRFNANGVDLNRNFDNSNWVSGTYFLNDFYPNGGGLVPFSEPESVAIKNLVERESPYLTISYHSAAGYVIPNNTLTAIELGNIYSQLSGYRYIAPGTEGAFTYDITGTFERWAQENGHNALVIELSSAYNDQFSLNKIAMWDMIKR